MKKKNFIAFYVFFLIILFSFALVPSEVQSLNPTFVESWKEEISPFVNYVTLEIILNNLFVVLVLWLFSIIPAWVYYKRPRNPEDEKRLIRTIYTAYTLYFIKEGIRNGLLILSFNYTPYIFTLITLILPHGVAEIGAFALTADISLEWVRGLSGEFKAPKIKHLTVPIILVVLSGILETTLTPYIFKTLL